MFKNQDGGRVEEISCAIVTLILCCSRSAVGSRRHDDRVNPELLFLASPGCASCFYRLVELNDAVHTAYGIPYRRQ